MSVAEAPPISCPPVRKDRLYWQEPIRERGSLLAFLSLSFGVPRDIFRERCSLDRMEINLVTKKPSRNALQT